MGSPFDPSNDTGYRRWRARKLATAPTSLSELGLTLASDAGPSAAELAQIRSCAERANMALIRLPEGWERSGAGLRRLGAALGLARLDQNLCADEDGISAIRVADQRRANEYIPYTDRPLSWHTDGYYNAPEQQIRAWALLCARPAAEGGENQLLDPEIAYLLLRDENPDYVAALMRPDAMTIPPNVENGVELRPQQSGPVFSVEKRSAALHMRYTARTRSIEWRDDRNTRLAAGFLAELLASDADYIIRHRLESGQGVICNNVLHRREAFADDAESGQQRLLYRARYHDRIAGTELLNCLSEDWKCSG